MPRPAGVLGGAFRRFGVDGADASLRQAAWAARCVGRGEGTPLRHTDVAALADALDTCTVDRDTVIFERGEQGGGVWLVRAGRVELSLGSRRRRSVVCTLGSGDVDGDIQLLLDIAMPYTARALTEVTYLHMSAASFDLLMRANPELARYWMSSVAFRLTTSQDRILALLGRSLPEQVARLLLDEAEGGRVTLSQRTMAAMLGARRRSLKAVLEELENDNVIEINNGVIAIYDYDQLADQAG
ncbi:Crp/Fnr family transcriptional regulator [Phytoactinopolyspora halophila]|nr:Crp/Fnr family transcriptional regulator [Phytoactinopolyspora halophila]